MKMCSKCKESKPRSSFGVDARNSDNMKNWCKQCNREWWHSLKKTAEGRRKVNNWRGTQKMKLERSNVGQEKFSKVSQEKFYELCEALKLKEKKKELDGKSHDDLCLILSKQLGIRIPSSALSTAKKATGIKWVSPKPHRSHSRGERIETLEKIVRKMCADLGVDLSEFEVFEEMK